MKTKEMSNYQVSKWDKWQLIVHSFIAYLEKRIAFAATEDERESYVIKLKEFRKENLS
tara:strand:- start:8011 stop:8184 length:174 start_codon:yes stop_codon:yes gene_type:complete